MRSAINAELAAAVFILFDKAAGSSALRAAASSLALSVLSFTTLIITGETSLTPAFCLKHETIDKKNNGRQTAKKKRLKIGMAKMIKGIK
jgi:hypothetical protein